MGGVSSARGDGLQVAAQQRDALSATRPPTSETVHTVSCVSVFVTAKRVPNEFSLCVPQSASPLAFQIPGDAIYHSSDRRLGIHRTSPCASLFVPSYLWHCLPNVSVDSGCICLLGVPLSCHPELLLLSPNCSLWPEACSVSDYFPYLP